MSKEWKIILAAIAICVIAIILTNCQAVDDATGTSFNERCFGYRIILANLEAEQERDPSANLGRAIFNMRNIVALCPPLPEPEVSQYIHREWCDMIRMDLGGGNFTTIRVCTPRTVA